jgi:hypothetical protein
MSSGPPPVCYYSKTLWLDPAGPVVGLANGVWEGRSHGIHINHQWLGLAGHGIGEHKAMVDGEDVWAVGCDRWYARAFCTWASFIITIIYFWIIIRQPLR